MTDDQIRQAFIKYSFQLPEEDEVSYLDFEAGYKSALASLELQGYSYSINDTYVGFCVDEPPDDAYDEGSLVTLYRIKEKS